MARFLAYSKPRTVPPRVRAAGSHATRRTTASATAALSTSASERGAQRRECGQDLWSTPPCRPCSPAATGPGSPRRPVPHRHPPRTHRSVSPSQAMCPSPCTRPSRSLVSPSAPPVQGAPLDSKRRASVPFSPLPLVGVWPPPQRPLCRASDRFSLPFSSPMCCAFRQACSPVFQ